MRPVFLRARNFRTFPDLDLQFGSGVIGILGELRDSPEGADSNGAGKSSILEAIDIALFGRRSLAGYITRGGVADEVMVELVFEHAGATYRVRRTYSPKGRGVTKVDLERSQPAEEEEGVTYGFRAPLVFETLTQATGKETDALLQDIIGLSQQTFRDSAYLRQGDGGYADPDRDPKQRKELLVEAVLGRDPVWPKLADTARARRRAAETLLEGMAGEERVLREQAADAGQAAIDAEDAATYAAATVDALRTVEARRDEAVQVAAAARERVAARQAAQAELAAAQQNLARLNELVAAAMRAEKDAEEARTTLASLATPEQVQELEGREIERQRLAAGFREAQVAYAQDAQDYDFALARRADLLARAAGAKEKADRLRDLADGAAEDDRCERCGQVLTAEASEHTAKSLRADADALVAQAATLTAEADRIELIPAGEEPVPPDGIEDLEAVRRLASVRVEQQDRARLEERVAQLERSAEAAPTEAEIEAAQEDLDAKHRHLHGLLEAVEPDVNVDDANRAVAAAQACRDEAVAAKARADERLTTIRRAQARLAELAKETTAAHRLIDRDALLEKANGRDGIPALIIENTAIPSIEAEASRILRALGAPFDVQLRTQSETKAGTLRDTLDVVVIDPDGNEADYADGCSGGEQTRIGLALRIALARLLAHRRGAESRLLALDEPSYLDAAGMTALLDVLRGLSDEFDVILLVSHVAELRDALDETITVVKEAGVSSIAGAPVLAAVSEETR